MIRAFLGWWAAQLLSLLPDNLAQRGAGGHGLATLRLLSPPGVTPATVAIHARSRRRQARPPVTLTLQGQALVQLRNAVADSTAIRLDLPPGAVLERDVTLPLAAERAPAQVLGYELDRLTPFRAEDVFWSCRVVGRDRERGRLQLRLALMPRAPLAPLLDLLRDAGLRPTLLQGAGGPPIPLDGAATPRSPALLRAGLVACAVLALATIVTPFVRQSFALAAVQDRLDAVAPAVAEATALRRRIAAAAAGGDVMAAAHEALGDPLQAIAAATEALPDDTFLTDLTLRRRRLTLAGRSGNAVQLIARLAAEPALRSPAFTAPVTRGDSGHVELFSIGAELEP